MLARRWRNWKLLALLVECKMNGAAIVENNSVDPQNLNIELPYDPLLSLYT